MKFRSFSIKNFKGIRECTIELQNDTPGFVTTLIGLNESGKTTILEAIANFISEDANLPAVFDRKELKTDIINFIPKHRKANFTDSTTIAAEVELSAEDIQTLCTHFASADGMEIDSTSFAPTIEITRTYKFKDSKPDGATSYWTFPFSYKEKGKRKYLHADGTDGSPTRDFWLRVVKYVSDRIPRICYFPTFLFQLPDRVYLEQIQGESAQNSYYRQILQDVLDAQGEGLSLKKHVVDRLEKERNAEGEPSSLIFRLREKDEHALIDAVFRKMSAELSRVILGAWAEIFHKKPKNTQIVVDWSVDLGKGNAPYIQFFVLQGQDKFAISERSLGFRWFFSFLLFTQFRAHRKEDKGVIFLFDEPASNLHSRAQQELLRGFPRISGKVNHIVYSTHSHYMVEPLWLEKAYIVCNRATEHEEDATADPFHYQPTDIFAEKYRKFVGEHSDRTSFFQPVLDRLEYAASPLIGRETCLLVEGKHDYYAMRYFQVRSEKRTAFDILPGCGAPSLGTLISLLLGWGRRFVVLLDDDPAGRAARDRYRTDYLLRDDQVVTLGDIVPILAGKKFEQILGDDFVDEVRRRFGVTGHVGKKQIALYFQEAISTLPAGPPKGSALAQAQERFDQLFETVAERLAARY